MRKNTIDLQVKVFSESWALQGEDTGGEDTGAESADITEDTAELADMQELRYADTVLTEGEQDD